MENDNNKLVQAFANVMRQRDENNGQHFHHQHCIHNLTPEEQIAARGKTVEWWKCG